MNPVAAVWLSAAFAALVVVFRIRQGAWDITLEEPIPLPRWMLAALVSALALCVWGVWQLVAET